MFRCAPRGAYYLLQCRDAAKQSRRSLHPVTDIARAREFYEQKVGLVAREEAAGGVVYECAGGSWIFLYQSSGAGTSRASQAFWQVQDIEKEVADLRSRGVVFEEYDRPGALKTVNGISEGGGTKAAWFKDSEGNIMALIQSDPANA